MNYPAEYERALKYAMVDEGTVKKFIDAHHDKDPDALNVLRDYFDDHGDPRGEILHRALGHTQFPGDTKDFQHLTIHRPLVEFNTGDMAVGDHNSYAFYPQPKHETPHVYVSWHHSQRMPDYEERAKNWSHTGPLYRDVSHRAYFTPDEARRLADHFPEEHAAEIHAVLDHHFGPRPTE